MVRIAQTITEVKQIRNDLLMQQKTIGFVPTMGFLHSGHLSLIERSSNENDCTIVSIYVNPTQFAPDEDLDSYPRDFDGDVSKAESAGADLIFYPSNEDMYRSGHQTYVTVDEISSIYEGDSRPTHFRGVTTIVCKLFNIVQPHRAYFGQKDAQQAFLIKKMADELDMDVHLEILPTIREDDGLAMSSRNKYLQGKERQLATMLYRTLVYGRELFLTQQYSPEEIVSKLEHFMDKENSVKRDYIAIVSPDTFQTLKEPSSTALAVGAMYVGKTRLIDNLFYQLED